MGPDRRHYLSTGVLQEGFSGSCQLPAGVQRSPHQGFPPLRAPNQPSEQSVPLLLCLSPARVQCARRRCSAIDTGFHLLCQQVVESGNLKGFGGFPFVCYYKNALLPAEFRFRWLRLNIFTQHITHQQIHKGLTKKWKNERSL